MLQNAVAEPGRADAPESGSRLDAIGQTLARWLGERPDLQVPAWGVSVMAHLAVLLALGMVGYAAHTERAAEFRTEVVDTALPDLVKSDTVELAELEKPTAFEPTAGSFAPTVAPIVVAPAPETQAPPTELARLEVGRPTRIVLPMATRLDTSVTIRGSGSEHVGAVEGAVDRIAVEILRRLEKGRTLVVWAFDASGSLVAERERLGKHIARVYADVLKMDSEGLARDEGLLTAVAAFGEGFRWMTREPTADPAAVASAIAEVPVDGSGVENTFHAVGQVVNRYAKFRKGGHRYGVMTIVVTDEVGDDDGVLEEAIAMAHDARMPVYVLGSPALFARAEGFADYKDPKTGRVYRGRPVHQGPEGAALEQIRLPFWYDGPQYEFLDSGFGPYALSRLAGATGGIYFITRMGPNRITFDPTGMREYKPDWVSRAQYEAAVARHPVRAAVIQAASITQQNNLPHAPGLTFPAAESPDFKEAMKHYQEIVARIQYTVDAALEPIVAAARHRDRETSRRWQAHYDLIRGRLTAMKIRCFEYNWACATMKKDMPKFQKPGSNAWRLVPDEEIHYSEKAAAAGKQARELLKRVVDEHPGTPWAILAQRERKDPFGFRWVEVTVPPPPKPQPESAAAKKKMKEAPPPKPEELPKL